MPSRLPLRRPTAMIAAIYALKSTDQNLPDAPAELRDADRG